MSGYVFVHVPKTAGFSFWTGARAMWGEDQVTHHIDDFPISPELAAQMASRKMIAGHISMSDVEKYYPTPDRKWLTILRDPTQRAISQYYFLVKLGDPQFPDVRLARELSIEEYFALPKERLAPTVWNRMVRQLGAQSLDATADLASALARAKINLKRFAWVGFQEDLSAGMKRLRATLPDLAGLEMPRVRVTPDKPSLKDIPASVILRVAELTQFDWALYEWARATRPGGVNWQ